MKIQCENCGHIYNPHEQEPVWISDDSVGVDCPACGSYTNVVFFKDYEVKEE